jgi:hypothetical protein
VFHALPFLAGTLALSGTQGPPATPSQLAGRLLAAGGDQDWIIPAGTTVVFDTSSSLVNGHVVNGGVVGVHDLRVEAGAVLRVLGPNPFVVTASGSVQIDGLVDLSGNSSNGVVTLNTTSIPELGAAGQAGGGKGGTGSPLTRASSPMGGAGFGALGTRGGGGGGGEAGWSTSPAKNLRRGGGGGGGRFGPDVFDQSEIGFDAEPGFDNDEAENGALSGPGPAHGGSVGLTPFTDGNPRNDFYGVQLELGSGAILQGELATPWAGAGGGGGGDASRVPSGGTYPPPFNPQGDEKGAGGGGGGGSLHLSSLGPISFGPQGEIRARGGSGGGGENTLFLDRVGGGSGGGSGGHVVLETAAYINLSASLGPALAARGGQGGAGKDDVGGAFFSSGGPKETSPAKDACPSGFTGCLGLVNGAGGDGGPGLVQLHVPIADEPFANIRLPSGATLAELSEPLPVGVANGGQMLPTFETRGRAPLFQAVARRSSGLDLRLWPRLPLRVD